MRLTIIINKQSITKIIIITIHYDPNQSLTFLEVPSDMVYVDQNPAILITTNIMYSPVPFSH